MRKHDMGRKELQLHLKWQSQFCHMHKNFITHPFHKNKIFFSCLDSI